VRGLPDQGYVLGVIRHSGDLQVKNKKINELERIAFICIESKERDQLPGLLIVPERRIIG
jgi:hypothetical protein